MKIVQKASQGTAVAGWHKPHLHYRGHTYVAGKYLLVFVVCVSFIEDVWKNNDIKADKNSKSPFNRIILLQRKAWVSTILMIEVILEFLKGEIFPFVFEAVLEEIWITLRLGFGKHFSYFF